MVKFELHLKVDHEISLLDLIIENCELSINQIKIAVQKGALWVSKVVTNSKLTEAAVAHNKYTKRLHRLKKMVSNGDYVHFYYDEMVLSQVTQAAQLISDQQDYSIWYKPYGMLCQGSKWSDHCTINRWAETHIKPQRSAFIVHRLDRAASGLIVIAHSKKAARAFSQLFEHHQLTKIYHIICHGDHRSHPQPEEITLPIDDKAANSSFKFLDYDPKKDISLIEVNIGSGRKHQIRKHAAAINLPIVGDRLHGDKNQHYNEQLNLQLSAFSLAFKCPFTQKQQLFTLPQKLQLQLENII